jgi:hypothetical protein
MTHPEATRSGAHIVAGTHVLSKGTLVAAALLAVTAVRDRASETLLDPQSLADE